MRAVEDQSASIPEGITSELGGVRLLEGEWSLYARSEGQSSHPLGSQPFAHEWERDELDLDLHCSWNAHDETVLVQHAQWRSHLACDSDVKTTMM